MRKIDYKSETWLLKEPFVISRGSRTETNVILVKISEGEFTGYGESVPSKRYNETIESVKIQIESVKKQIENGLNRLELLKLLAPGSARNALDCALWDLEAKRSGKSVHEQLDIKKPGEIFTVQTISLGTVEEMQKSAQRLTEFPILKIKLNPEQVIEKMSAIYKANPKSRYLIDANESWTPELLSEILPKLEKLNVSLIEQPFPAGKDDALKNIQRKIPIAADESCHSSKDLESLVGKYDFINIKLDKSGGLTEAIQMVEMAKKLELGLMVGCMVGTSLSMAPAMLIARTAEFVDLDGPTMLLRDRENALSFHNGTITGYKPELWG